MFPKKSPAAGVANPSRFHSNSRCIPKSQRDWLALEMELLEERTLLSGVSTLDALPQSLIDGPSTISVIARGETGDESFSLLINDSVVATYETIGTMLQTFTYESGQSVSPSQIKVQFLNDLYDVDAGIDRNLVVDKIVVDSLSIESEDPSTFSTGTWLPADGITAGYRLSETLHTEGYFQYADPVASGSNIVIRARGDEGTESMSLWVDGGVVATWGVSDSLSNYSYVHSEILTADQIRISLNGDQYDPANNIDENLIVDYLSLDGQIYQTESPAVYSTGTWTAIDGIVPGFRQSEYLHTTGYFQYTTANNPNAGNISLAGSVFNVDEEAGTVSISVQRTGGSEGTVSVQFLTVGVTAAEGQDFVGQTGTLTFAPGETSKIVNISIIGDDVVEGNETFGFTIENVTGGGTLLAPRTATVTILDNDVSLPNYPMDFSDTSQLQFNGAANTQTNWLHLTSQNLNTAGSVFYKEALAVDAATSFQTFFQLQITGGTAGADGMTFVVQNSSDGVNALGATGGGLGYQSITNSIAIKFDTYQNANEINNNHVAVVVNGFVSTPLVTRVPDFDLNDGTNFNVWVDYNGSANQLAVYLSKTLVKPTSATMVVDVDLADIVGNQAFFGFTAGTGGLSNSHRVKQWTFNTATPPVVNPPIGDALLTERLTGGYIQPTAIRWLPDGTMLVAEQRGIVYAVKNGIKLATPFIDISDHVNGTRDRGLLDIEVHPDFENNPYVYLLYTYDPPEVYDNIGNNLAGPDQNGNRAGRLTRVTADISNDYLTAVAGSETVLVGKNSTWNNFNAFANSTVNKSEPAAGILPDGSNLQDFITSDSESHTVGALAWGLDGNLFVSIGDGASYNSVDPRAVRVQDIDNLSGKVLRIDPITGQGVADNPFYNGNADANRSKVYQLGLRNPFRMTVDPNSGELYIGDVGWTVWEEINSAGAGANFGWPFYEGGSGVSNRTAQYQNLPQAANFYANTTVTPSLYALNHSADGINAIVLGDVYTGTAYPEQFQGDLFFNDLGQGIVRHATLRADGTIQDIGVFTTGANIVVQIKQGPDGNLYFVDLDNGYIGRWVFV